MSAEAKKQNYINELKGHLFEFLLAQDLARLFEVELAFTESLGANYRKLLTYYQNELFKLDLGVYQTLPYLSQTLLKKTIVYWRPYLGQVKNIFLLGKNQDNNLLPLIKETDLWIQSKNGQSDLFLSLKLCKSNSFTNTKNAGIKSFFKQYFAEFPKVMHYQEDFNYQSNLWFQEMNADLKEYLGQQKLDHQLPGELPEAPRKILHQYYYLLAEKTYNTLKVFYDSSPQQFSKCIYPLIGLGSSNIGQLKCFYSIQKAHLHQEKTKYKFESFVFNQAGSHQRLLEGLKLMPYQKGKSFFYISSGKLQLQIRIKPMNSFNAGAFKVNCSVKEQLTLHQI